MKFLHAQIHVVELRSLEEQGVAPGTLELCAVRCPHCHDLYFAQVTRKLGPRERASQEARAATQLREECPDHAHRFQL